MISSMGTFGGNWCAHRRAMGSRRLSARILGKRSTRATPGEALSARVSASSVESAFTFAALNASRSTKTRFPSIPIMFESSFAAVMPARIALSGLANDTRTGRGCTLAGAISGIVPTPWSAVSAIVIVLESRSLNRESSSVPIARSTRRT